MSTAIAVPERATRAETLRLLLSMTRPRVMVLVVFTGLPGLLMGARWPGLLEGMLVLVGTALTGAACSAFNAYIERETDARMRRTRNRPLPTAALSPATALWFGVGTTAVSMAVLWAVGTPLAALVGLASILFYVFVYTLWLKPRTPQNIVIGGAAGATAPLIAEAAVNGSIGWGGWLLFLIIFLWTPPHFWAIALFRKEEYANAGIPMMPLVVGEQGTRWRMLAYTLLLIPAVLAPVALGLLGPLYLVAAVAVSGWFTWHGIRLLRLRDAAQARRVFKVSVQYLFILFGAMLVDLALRGGGGA